jgi:hypothetical protein
MDFLTVGNQLIASGPVLGMEFDTLTELLESHPGIDTVVLRNSPGGDAPTGYRVGALFRDKGLRTAVSGYCYSSCSRMFLGGRSRHFTDDYPPQYTEVGFHGHYGANGQLLPELVRRLGLKDWIIQYSDGKADPALVERWINIPRSRGMIHFYDPDLLRRNDASTFLCEGDEASMQSVFGCEPIRRSAFDLGIVTSHELITSNDQQQLRAKMPPRPPASGYASIDDIGKVPLDTEQSLNQYRSFLSARLPRAFAVSPDHRHSAWHFGTYDSMERALTLCAQYAQQVCQLYAVDEDVVWDPR